MAEAYKKDIWIELRKPFDPKAVGKLPRGGISLDYVGHAAVTDRLNTVVGPEGWELKPMAVDEYGRPVLDGQDMWCWLTINGVTKMCVGDGPSHKVRIGDALRNGAMRFGIALDLWSKDELESNIDHPENKNLPISVHPEETSRDISGEEIISDQALLQITNAVKLKGITPLANQKSVVRALAASYDVENPADLTTNQGRELYAKIKATDKPALEMLIEDK